MTISAKILGLGVATVDHVMTIPSYPEPDSKNESIASRFQMGGPVPVALAQLRRFGRDCHFLSAWGEEGFGSVIENRLSAEQIAFPLACRQDVSTSVTQIWLEETTGCRTLVTSRVNDSGTAKHVTEEFISQFNVLHLDCWPTDAAFAAANLMKQQSGLVCLDTGSPKPGVEELLKIADVVNCPKRFCEQFLGEENSREAARKIAAFGPRIVTVTDGEHGAVLHTQGETLFEPAMKLKQVVDTNGAGDSFSGALIHGVLSDWDPERILKFSSTCAGLKCQHIGNQEALPTEVQIELELRSRDS